MNLLEKIKGLFIDKEMVNSNSSTKTDDVVITAKQERDYYKAIGQYYYENKDKYLGNVPMGLGGQSLRVELMKEKNDKFAEKWFKKWELVIEEHLKAIQQKGSE